MPGYSVRRLNTICVWLRHKIRINHKEAFRIQRFSHCMYR